MPPLISVCIPAYDMHGQGAVFLGEALASLAQQSFPDFEVIVGDQSASGEIANVCASYTDRLAVRRLDTRSALRQAAANTNVAMDAAKGQIIKILFQDDILCDPQALAGVAEGFARPQVQWLLSGSCVTQDGSTVSRRMMPRWHEHIRFGKNTISSPSVLAMRVEARHSFDTALEWLMDVELYHRLHRDHGGPGIIAETHVANRLHVDQVSAGVTGRLKRRELNYVRRKHGLAGRGDVRAWAYRMLRSLT